ncbi:hydroxymethylglutaryl-CoA lyase [Lachnospiraceae bacterium]|uniref:hydroxymethylglutaryl-CoA lyase n=1 Tax=Extibacter sp. GGCC_0201 TaxID=2731209 RepID=UPI001AA1447C|nr:hydroxymethylglutaryl-CoA lyase [Extibacter sp. GGCC_0201]MBO1720390.1 hydroxymethylglutaryl-CoA lyase [Extibacter sp. GGCC_0201]BDF34492.1 hydroxymethylglutaryl-CoA lyase [Lachnospiraceae bacterium]BDF38494.1 hydroxymethylglutaryl-CoA lyase [Lachnospiraceae bacterium]
MRLPEKVKIIEVGPRDGFQNVKDFIDTADKKRIIDSLVDAGVRDMEITSFVHPKAVPQMADAMALAASVDYPAERLRKIALTPNARGARNAMSCGVKEVSYVISASEAHNKANVNRTTEESAEELRNIREAVPELKIRLDIATAFGCPYAGKVSREQVYKLIDTGRDAGIEEFVLCDTIGIANPKQTAMLAADVRQSYPDATFTFHLHNTRGLGLANILAAMQEGIDSFESSIGGLGGCPFAPGAAGNVATEDLVNMLDYMEIAHGVCQEKLLKAAALVRKTVHANLTGNMLNACTYDNI